MAAAEHPAPSSTDLRAWLLVAAFSLVLFMITAGTYNALGVVLPDMVRDLRFNWTEAGFGFTLLGAATGASYFIPLILIRRIGVRATLLAGTAVMAAGFACLAQAHGPSLYFLGAALCGVGYQMMALIPGTHVLAAVFKHRALPFGVYFTAGALGGVAGPQMVQVMHLAHGDWRAFWIVQAIAAVVVGALCALVVGDAGRINEASRHTDEDLAEEIADEQVHPEHRRVWRTPVDWTAAEALRTPQFYVLLAAYFGHLLIGVTVAAVSVAHLSQRGVAVSVAGTMLSIEALMQTLGRLAAGAIGDRIEPRYLLMIALAALVAGSAALGVASSYPMMLVYAVGSGIGFGVTLLAVTVLLLNYYGRTHNLEIFSLTCLIGAVSALGPTIAGAVRDASGGFTPAFEAFAGVIAVILIAVAFMKPPTPLPKGEGGAHRAAMGG